MIHILASLRRRLLDTYHHRPGRLWVSVNGIPVASLDISNKKNTLSITTKVAEPLSFIEVLGEQQIRLAMLNANSGYGNPIERAADIRPPFQVQRATSAAHVGLVLKFESWKGIRKS